MLERLLQFWAGKLLVLALLGFLATDFIITITLSAADAAAHLRENPFFRSSLGAQIPLTLGFVLLLTAVFLKGIKEAVGTEVRPSHPACRHIGSGEKPRKTTGFYEKRT